MFNFDLSLTNYPLYMKGDEIYDVTFNSF